MPPSGMLVSMTGKEPEVVVGPKSAPSKPKKYPNRLKSVRLNRKMTQTQAAKAMGKSYGGYVKIEQGDRRMDQEFLRRACAVFSANPEDVLLEINAPQGQSFAPQGEIDQEKLEDLVAKARNLLSSLPERDATQLLLSLISASRKP